MKPEHLMIGAGAAFWPTSVWYDLTPPTWNGGWGLCVMLPLTWCLARWFERTEREFRAEAHPGLDSKSPPET